MKFRKYVIKMYDDYAFDVFEPVNTPKKETIDYQLKHAKGDSMLVTNTFALFVDPDEIDASKRKLDLTKRGFTPLYIQTRWIKDVMLFPERREEPNGSKNQP